MISSGAKMSMRSRKKMSWMPSIVRRIYEAESEPRMADDSEGIGPAMSRSEGTVTRFMSSRIPIPAPSWCNDMKRDEEGHVAILS